MRTYGNFYVINENGEVVGEFTYVIKNFQFKPVGWLKTSEGLKIFKGDD